MEVNIMKSPWIIIYNTSLPICKFIFYFFITVKRVPKKQWGDGRAVTSKVLDR